MSLGTEDKARIALKLAAWRPRWSSVAGVAMVTVGVAVLVAVGLRACGAS